jgi:uncharacterized membrane protein YphA (DoxX/SURF4 family)
MDLETAVNFLGCSILISVGFLILLAAIIAGNNMVAIWWKSWGWSWQNWVNVYDPNHNSTGGNQQTTPVIK